MNKVLFIIIIIIIIIIIENFIYSFISFIYSISFLSLFSFLLADTFMKKLILVIVLPLSLAVFFVVVICLKFRPIFRAEKPDQIEKVKG